MIDLAALRARCAAQDAHHDAQMHDLLLPCKHRRITASARPAWLRDGQPVAVERRSLLDGLYAEYGRKRKESPHSRAKNAFGGHTKFTVE